MYTNNCKRFWNLKKICTVMYLCAEIYMSNTFALKNNNTLKYTTSKLITFKLQNIQLNYDMLHLVAAVDNLDLKVEIHDSADMPPGVFSQD